MLMKSRLLISCLMVAGLASLLSAKPVLLGTDPELPPAARYGLAVLEA